MARKSTARSGNRGKRQLPQIRPLPWTTYDHASDYLAHLLCECGRLGLVDQWKYPSRDDWRVLSELLRWRDDQPSKAIGEIGDWLWLDISRLADRAKSGGRYNARPRIEISAEITTKDNLTVRWYPKGYHSAGYDFGDSATQYGCSLQNRRFRDPPDYRFFVEGQQYAAQRPSHEIMFIRGVGRLRPEEREYGPYVACNQEVVHELLICATRALFNQLISGLRESFDVTVLNDFEFDLIEEPQESSGGPSYSHSFVRGWRLINVAQAAPPSDSDPPAGEVVQFPKRDE